MARMSMVAALAALLLSGCTTDITLPSQASQPAAKKSLINLQSQSSAPGDTYRDITATQLLPGDILFSSSVGATSVGIRLFSIASVSHVAVYIGEEEVAEAVGSGVQIVTLQQELAHSDKLFVLRNPSLTPEQAQKIRDFAVMKKGKGYNFAGIVKMMPFMLTKQVCTLNPFSADFRQQCVAGLASSQLDNLTPEEEQRYFCSQFVIAAYQYSGQPLTTAQSSWISPADILHMREGDIATIAPVQPLQYVGHLSPGIYFKARKLTQLSR